jgi:hypothetical protein
MSDDGYGEHYDDEYEDAEGDLLPQSLEAWDELFEGIDE